MISSLLNADTLDPSATQTQNIMVFLSEHTVPVPEKDLVSWIFDHVPYDQDQPVSTDTQESHHSFILGLQGLITLWLIVFTDIY